MISHPEKVLFPDDGITKGELAAYYQRMAPLQLPHVARRPLTMERYPSGIRAKGFWQKDAPKGTPEWIERVEVPKRNGVVRYPLITDARGIMWAANLNAITQHVWTARAPRLLEPDLCVFDLDPAEDETAERLRTAVLRVRDLLDALGLPCAVKTTGSKGFHVVVPLDGSVGAEEAMAFCDAVGERCVTQHPDVFTRQFYKADRGGRILMDTGRNHPGATFAAPYTVRARPGAPVSAPCTWAEVEGGEAQPQTFTLRNMAARVESVGDLWADLYSQGVLLTEAADRLARLA